MNWAALSSPELGTRPLPCHHSEMGVHFSKKPTDGATAISRLSAPPAKHTLCTPSTSAAHTPRPPTAGKKGLSSQGARWGLTYPTEDQMPWMSFSCVKNLSPEVIYNMSTAPVCSLSPHRKSLLLTKAWKGREKRAGHVKGYYYYCLLVTGAEEGGCLNFWDRQTMIGSRWMDGLLLGADNEFHFVTAHLLQKGDDTAVCVPSSLHWNGSCTDQTRTQQRFLYIKQERKRADLQLLSSKSIHSKNLMGKGRLSHFFAAPGDAFDIPGPSRRLPGVHRNCFSRQRSTSAHWQKVGSAEQAQAGLVAAAQRPPPGRGQPLQPILLLRASGNPGGCSPHVLQQCPGCPLPPRSITSRHLQSRWDVSDTGKGGGSAAAWLIPGTARPFKLCCRFENGFRAFPW